MTKMEKNYVTNSHTYMRGDEKKMGEQRQINV
jgi:hypothetical protein